MSSQGTSLDQQLVYQEIDSPLGVLVLAVSDKGLVSVQFKQADSPLEALPTPVEAQPQEQEQAGCLRGRTLAAEVAVDGEVSLEIQGRERVLLRRAVKQIGEYLRGERFAFEVELDLSQVEGIQLKVLMALRTIGYGQQVSYGQLAEIVGNPGAARAVGSALAQNPLPLVLPCHRVVRSNGQLAGYEGGLKRKQWLLALEQQCLPVALAKVAALN